jgi:hypothetical protein
MRRLLVLVFVLGSSLVAGITTAHADPEGSWDGYVKDTQVVINGTVRINGTLSAPRDGPDGDPWEFQWLLACMQNRPGVEMTDCGNASRCPRAEDLLWTLWGRALPTGQWMALAIECRGGRPPDAPKPKLTPDRVLEAVRRIGLPSLQVRVQPDTATLVNFATIFYAEPQTFERTVSLLGFSVDVRAEPSSYRWVFGDGQEATTQSPGAPYPATDITHKYADAHVTVNPRVDVTYEVQYRVDGGAWQALDETLTAQGPATELRIKEATPVLSGGG